MKHITLLAWIGLGINILAYFFLMPLTTQELGWGDFSPHNADPIAFWFWVVTTGSLVLQAVALVLLPVCRMPALITGFAASVSFIPIGMIYLLGFKNSGIALLYRDFARTSSPPADARFISPFRYGDGQFFLGGIALCAGVALFVLGGGHSVLLILIGAYCLCLGVFARNHQAVYLDGERLFFYPDVFVPAVVVPLSWIQRVDAAPDARKCTLTVESPAGVRVVKLPMGLSKAEDQPVIVERLRDQISALEGAAD